MNKLLDNNFFDKSLVKRFIEYGFSVGLTTVSNFILVLVVIRILNSETYASFALTKQALIMLGALGSLGLSQAAVRYSQKKNYNSVLSNCISSVSIFSIPSSFILLLILSLFPNSFGFTLNFTSVAFVFSSLACFMVLNELINWTRAKERSDSHLFLNSFRALTEALFIIFMVYKYQTPLAFFKGLVCADLFLILFSLFFYKKLFNELFRNPRMKESLEMISYGWPFSIVISSGFLLVFADRFLISIISDDLSDVAYYDAGYFLVSSLISLIIRPYNLLLFPHIVKLYETRQEKDVSEFIRSSLRYFVYLVVIVSTIFIFFKETLFSFFYPDEYLKGVEIVGLVIAGTFLSGVSMAVMQGLYIKDRTKDVAKIFIYSLVVNILSNLLLIPIYGFYGAAIATFITFSFQLIISILKVRKYFHLVIPKKLIFTSTFYILFLDYFY